MSRDPSRRPRSAGELARRLRAALEPHATVAVPMAAGRRADAGPRPGAQQPSDRQRAPVAPVISADVSASVPGSSRTAVSAAPNAAGRPSSDRRAHEPILSAAHPQPPAVAWHRGRSRARILAATSIALAAAAVVLAVTISENGSQTRPRGASASRRVSPLSGHSRTTATTSARLTGTAPAIAATQSNSPPASTAPAGTDPSVAPATGDTTTAARSKATHRTTTTAPSRPPTNLSPATARGPATTTPGSPVSAAESFYQLAAAHRYSEAWALADPTFRSQLGGYDSFQAGQAGDRSITFDAAHVTSQSSTGATVAVHTTSVRSNRTQHCAGTIDLVSGSTSGGWLLHLIHINCA